MRLIIEVEIDDAATAADREEAERQVSWAVAQLETWDDSVIKSASYEKMSE